MQATKEELPMFMEEFDSPEGDLLHATYEGGVGVSGTGLFCLTRGLVFILLEQYLQSGRMEEFIPPDILPDMRKARGDIKNSRKRVDVMRSIILKLCKDSTVEETLLHFWVDKVSTFLTDNQDFLGRFRELGEDFGEKVCIGVERRCE